MEEAICDLDKVTPYKNCAVTKIISSGATWPFRPPYPVRAQCFRYTEP